MKALIRIPGKREFIAEVNGIVMKDGKPTDGIYIVIDQRAVPIPKEQYTIIEEKK